MLNRINKSQETEVHNHIDLEEVYNISIYNIIILKKKIITFLLVDRHTF